jgi:hypothetical protein
MNKRQQRRRFERARQHQAFTSSREGDAAEQPVPSTAALSVPPPPPRKQSRLRYSLRKVMWQR